MAILDRFPRRRIFSPLAFASLLTAAVSMSIAPCSNAQVLNQPDAEKPVFKVPPLPVGSAHVRIQPGMSKKDWNDAYKETGRPKFNQNTVKRAGGTIERD